MQAFQAFKLRLVTCLALAALVMVMLAPISKAEASADSTGVYRPQVSWNSGPQ